LGAIAIIVVPTRQPIHHATHHASGVHFSLAQSQPPESLVPNALKAPFPAEHHNNSHSFLTVFIGPSLASCAVVFSAGALNLFNRGNSIDILIDIWPSSQLQTGFGCVKGQSWSWFQAVR
jgi:hypothetical protein